MQQAGPYWLTWQGRRTPLRPGGTVTIGRLPTSTLVLPADDRHLSRSACEVRVLEDHLEVVNVSEHRHLRVRPPIGADVVVPPRASTSTRGLPSFSIVFVGGDGHEYEIAGVGRSVLPSPATPSSAARTVGGVFHLSPTERRMLAALCRPLVEQRGPAAVPPSYAEIGKEIGTTGEYVRKVLGEVRARVVAEGAPGFGRVPGARSADHRLALAEHALRSGWRLEPGGPG